MKTVFAYIRVSTHKQGSEGASLPEQKDSIQRFCQRNNLHILRWFEEQETAAKRGRKEFSEMLKLVKKGKAQGLVFHKIDRSTRNLFEWAEVSSLPEQGIEVHYSHEPVDLTTTHGRTAADVAAVFAASYIRNLREEVKKGLQGRLKQGIYPFKAPLGYLDNGKGQFKTIDPLKGPLVRMLFERYATGEYSFNQLLGLANKLGLVGMRDTPLTMNGLTCLFRNTFYMGVITVRKTGDSYEGGHEPLISARTFKAVQEVLSGKKVPRQSPSRYLFQKMLKCSSCGYCLIAERQRGLLYYRCHTCKGVCVRETEIERMLAGRLFEITPSAEALGALREDITSYLSSGKSDIKVKLKTTGLQIDALAARLDRLTDQFLDGVIDKDEYQKRKATILHDKLEKEAERQTLSRETGDLDERVETYLEQAITLSRNHFLENVDRRRLFLKTVTSNMSISGKTLAVQWREPFQTLSEQLPLTECDDYRDTSRRQPNHTSASSISKKTLRTKASAIRKITEAVVDAVRYQDHTHPEFTPFPPSSPSNTTWRENFRKRPS